MEELVFKAPNGSVCSFTRVPGAPLLDWPVPRIGETIEARKVAKENTNQYLQG